MATVRSPTPPGTGVIAPATAAAASKSTSPTSFFGAMRLMPTSITVAPSFTISAVTKRGRPTAATRMSAVRAIAGAFSADPAPQSTPQSVVQSGALDASGYTLKGGQEATADGLLTDGTTIDIPACLDRDITATAKASPVASGSAMPVTLTLENRGSVACSTSLTRFNLAVTTGDHQVYDSSRCADSQQSSMTLLLRPGGTWSGSLSWDGYVYTNGCTAPAGGASAAAAGTYKVAVTMGTREVGSTVVDVTPAPTPAPQSGAQSGAQSGTQSDR